MHVVTLTDVNFVLVFDESREDFEKSCNIEEFWPNIEILIGKQGFLIPAWVGEDPGCMLMADSFWYAFFFHEDDLIVVRNLDLGDYLHNDVLVFCYALIIK